MIPELQDVVQSPLAHKITVVSSHAPFVPGCINYVAINILRKKNQNPRNKHKNKKQTIRKEREKNGLIVKCLHTAINKTTICIITINT